jgi:hypothetical protein
MQHNSPPTDDKHPATKTPSTQTCAEMLHDAALLEFLSDPKVRNPSATWPAHPHPHLHPHPHPHPHPHLQCRYDLQPQAAPSPHSLPKAPSAAFYESILDRVTEEQRAQAAFNTQLHKMQMAGLQSLERNIYDMMAFCQRGAKAFNGEHFQSIEDGVRALAKRMDAIAESLSARGGACAESVGTPSRADETKEPASHSAAPPQIHDGALEPPLAHAQALPPPPSQPPTPRTQDAVPVVATPIPPPVFFPSEFYPDQMEIETETGMEMGTGMAPVHHPLQEDDRRPPSVVDGDASKIMMVGAKAAVTTTTTTTTTTTKTTKKTSKKRKGRGRHSKSHIMEPRAKRQCSIRAKETIKRIAAGEDVGPEEAEGDGGSSSTGSRVACKREHVPTSPEFGKPWRSKTPRQFPLEYFIDRIDPKALLAAAPKNAPHYSMHVPSAGRLSSEMEAALFSATRPDHTEVRFSADSATFLLNYKLAGDPVADRVWFSMAQVTELLVSYAGAPSNLWNQTKKELLESVAAEGGALDRRVLKVREGSGYRYVVGDVGAAMWLCILACYLHANHKELRCWSVSVAQVVGRWCEAFDLEPDRVAELLKRVTLVREHLSTSMNVEMQLPD